MLIKMNEYFKTHIKITLTLMWVFFAIAVGYGVLCLTLFPNWFFWLMLIPAFLALYFRVVYSKGYYQQHPERDKYSEQYIPYKERKKLEQEKKNRKGPKK